MFFLVSFLIFIDFFIKIMLKSVQAGSALGLIF